jgi:Mor family transcriptional regulator
MTTSRGMSAYEEFERDRLICREYEAGNQVSVLANEFDLSISAIYRALKIAGVKRRGRSKDARNDELVERYLSGEEPKDLATAYGISQARTYQILKRAGLTSDHRLTDQDKYEIVNLWHRGLYLMEIVRRTGRSQCTVRRVLEQNGLREPEPARPEQPHEFKTEIIKRFEAGETYDQIAHEMQITRNVVAGTLKRAGVRRIDVMEAAE